MQLLSVTIRRGVQIKDRRGLQVQPFRPLRVAPVGNNVLDAHARDQIRDPQKWVTLRRKNGVHVRAFACKDGWIRIRATSDGGQVLLRSYRVRASVYPVALVVDLPQEDLWLRFDCTVVPDDEKDTPEPRRGRTRPNLNEGWV